MDIGFVGLGRMGASMTRRLAEGGHRVVAYDRSAEATAAVKAFGAEPAGSLEELVKALPSPKAVWVMVPAGDPTEQTIAALGLLLSAGDVVVDGGNSFYKDSVRRSEELADAGIAMVDAGTSGGVWGYEVGYCLMCGGEASAYEIVRPAIETLAPPAGSLHVGPSGAGHYAKMIHNGIEYAMLQSYGEGFEVLAASPYGFDLAALADLWGKGSVVRSWLLELLATALAKDGRLEHVKGYVEDSGEGRWTIAEAIERDVPVPAITTALFERFRSRQDESFSAKVIAALRREFGGHAIKPE